jgi:2-oxoisovalerate dehydrogenase E1 component alpha subunit
MVARLSPHLEVPHPPARPGEKPDFSYLALSPAGALPRPPVLANFRDTVPLSEGLIRVLDDSGRPIGEWNPQVSDERLIEGLGHMALTRAYDDRMFRTQRQGRITFYMKSTGEEAVSVAAGMALRPDDMLFPAYRNQALQFVRRRKLVDLMCQLLSNTRDMCKGRQLPVFYHSPEANLFTISGNLATQFPQAVGWAMASAIKGEDRVAATWLGDGSTAEGDFHHALTFASVYKAPVILNVANNQWAISTFQAVAGGTRQTFAARGPSYGIPGLRVDGNDFLAVYGATSWAAERARLGGGATLIELVTYRVAGHSTSDDPSRYRPNEEARFWPLGDPLDRLKQHLIARGSWSDAQHEELVARCESEVAQAWQEARSYGTLTEGPRLDPSLMFEDVYKEMPEHLKRQRDELLAELGKKP